MSYDVPTPSAMRGLLEAVWHPGMRWVIDKIYVEKPIRFTSIRRNEVKCKLSAANARTVLGGDRNGSVPGGGNRPTDFADSAGCPLCGEEPTSK